MRRDWTPAPGPLPLAPFVVYVNQLVTVCLMRAGSAGDAEPIRELDTKDAKERQKGREVGISPVNPPYGILNPCMT
jgi:hypothetical protein